MSLSEKSFNALGDPTRRIIFEKLRNGGLAVSEIAEGLSVSRPAVSQHIKILKDAKLIRVHKKGSKNICQIDKDGVMAMRFYLDKFWEDALAAFKIAAEETEKSTKL